MTLILKSSPILKSDNIEIFDDLRKAIKVFHSKEKSNEYVQQFPSLPDWINKTYKYKEYEVNLFKFCCTCEEFKKNSLKYCSRDIRLACKHIYFKLVSSKAALYIDETIELMIKNAAIFHEEGLYKFNIKDNLFYLGYRTNTEWINIYYNAINFSYNILERRWRSNLPPKNALEIIYYIDQLFSVKKEVVRIK